MQPNKETEFWNERYYNNERVYGLEPNLFFKDFIDNTHASTLLLPCEGEGRNAIYAAKKGWTVDAFDFSKVAVQKTLQRAEKENVSISYQQKRIEDYEVNKHYNLIALIYVHMNEIIRKDFQKKLIDSLTEGGTIILEAFNKRQLNYQSGGPKEIGMLYSKENLQEDFAGLTITLLEEKIIDLQEGEFHKGNASIIRMIATK